eukprot:g15074.t1
MTERSILHNELSEEQISHRGHQQRSRLSRLQLLSLLLPPTCIAVALIAGASIKSPSLYQQVVLVTQFLTLCLHVSSEVAYRHTGCVGTNLMYNLLSKMSWVLAGAIVVMLIPAVDDFWAKDVLGKLYLILLLTGLILWRV